MKDKEEEKVNKKISKNISVHSDLNSFYLDNFDYFLTISDVEMSNGIDIVRNIFILSKEVEFNEFRKNNGLNNSYIAKNNLYNIDYFIEYSNTINVVNFTSTNLNLRNITKNLKMNSCNDGFANSKLDLGQIIIIKKVISPKELINFYKIAIETKLKYFEYLKLPNHIQNIINNNEFLIIASRIPENFIENDENNVFKLFNQNFKNFKEYSNKQDTANEDDEDLDDIEKELVMSVIRSCNNFLKKLNISFGILDYIMAEGISIDDLVDAGMELCVGVKETKELRKKLKNQILKSLEDLNVIALLMSAIRCEADFQNNRLREVNVSDDPAYLYSDEVLGLAIANQIAGTKATFNFKRYDEAKPGIIAKLGPMVDDIFAGLIAGCMSKIFEE